MGFERNALALFLKLRRENVRLGRLLTLGRQNLHLDRAVYRRIASKLELAASSSSPAYADGLLRALGASSVEALDASDYEGATLLHDLNQPAPAAWHEQFDVILDGGTLEHVFNLPVGLASCMQMLKPGGRFVAVTVANNWCGHGFYQFSPELFFRVFNEENGFSLLDLIVANADGTRHYAVADPASVGARVELWSSEPIYLLVHARRDTVRPVFARAPSQSDYVKDWTAGSSMGASAPRAAWKELPGIRQALQMRGRRYWRRRRSRSLDDRRFFTPISLDV